MIELAINVKLSAAKLDSETAETQKKWSKVMVCILSLPVIPLGVYQAKLGADFISTHVHATGWRFNFYICFTPVILIFLAIGLCYSCFYLIKRMYKYFDSSLKEEVSRIRTVFMVFMISYVTRAVISLMLSIA